MRPRKHQDNAARQQAYRQRKAANVTRPKAPMGGGVQPRTVGGAIAVNAMKAPHNRLVTGGMDAEKLGNISAAHRKAEHGRSVVPTLNTGMRRERPATEQESETLRQVAHMVEGRCPARVDMLPDVLMVQSLAMADDELRLRRLKELRQVARALMPLQRKAHPNEDGDRLWERALERAFVILNGVEPPKEGQ